jgi:hypothetical protein
MESIRDISTFPETVVWSRGSGCGELAELLATGRAHQIESNPAQTCIERRADLAVMRSAGSFDLVPVAVPSQVLLDSTTLVVAAVSTGPHSDLAAVIAARLGDALSVPARALTAVRPGAVRNAAVNHLSDIDRLTGLTGDIVETEHAAQLVDSLPSGTLVVLGAPGGSWLTRQFFGPGARLRSHAPSGTVVVRDAAPKAFQRMAEPSGIGPHAFVRDVITLMATPTVPVVEAGLLIGIVRMSKLRNADPDAEVGDLVEDPPFVVVDDEVSSLVDLVEFFDNGPIPVIDREGRLAGLLTPDVFE